jgi:hypothetical protein
MPRKEKKYHFIYKTTNLLSGKYYIGMHSTDSIKDGYLGSGKRLRYSINKYGVENHKREILEFVGSRKELIAREKEIVNLNEIAKEECLNLKAGGEGGFISIEQQRQRSIAGGKAFSKKIKEDEEFKNIFKENNSKRLINDYKNGLREIKYFYDWNGKKHSEESKKKISESKKGKNLGDLNSQFGTCWITKDGVNKKIKKEELNNFTQQGWVKGRK